MDVTFKALIEAVKKNSLTAVEKILSNKSVNFDINEIEDSLLKVTILHEAVLNRTIDSGIVELLLRNNAKVNVHNFCKRTPLHIAVRNNRIDVVELLLKHGADPNCRGELDRTSLHNCFNTHNMLLMNLIVKYKANINIKDAFGDNALHLAAEYGTYEMVESLIQMRMNVNEKNDSGCTPLHKVLLNLRDKTEDRLKKIRLLVDNEADVNAVNIDNNTPLCWAVGTGVEVDSRVDMLKVVNCLLQLGADPNIHGDTIPLWCAVLRQRVEAVELLIKYGANVHCMGGGLTLVKALMSFFTLSQRVNVERALRIAKLLLIRGVVLVEDDHIDIYTNFFRLLKGCQSEGNNLRNTRVCESCPLTYGNLLIARSESLTRYLRREDFRTAVKSAIDNKNFVNHFSDDLKKKYTCGLELIRMLDDFVDLLDEVFETVLTHDVVVVISQYFNEDDLKKCFNGNQERV